MGFGRCHLVRLQCHICRRFPDKALAALDHVPCRVGFLSALATFPRLFWARPPTPPSYPWERKLKASVVRCSCPEGRGPVLPLSSPTPSSTKPVPRACPPGPPPPSRTRCRAGPSGLPVLPARRFCALSPAPPARPAATPGAAAGLPVLAAPEPAVLQHQLVGRLGGARQGGGGAQGQRQGEGQQPQEERHGARGRGPREVRAPPPRARLSRRRAGGSGREGRGSRAPPPPTRRPRCAAPPQPQARAPRCALPGATGHPAAQRVWGAGSGDSVAGGAVVCWVPHTSLSSRPAACPAPRSLPGLRLQNSGGEG